MQTTERCHGDLAMWTIDGTYKVVTGTVAYLLRAVNERLPLLDRDCTVPLPANVQQRINALNRTSKLQHFVPYEATRSPRDGRWELKPIPPGDPIPLHVQREMKKTLTQNARRIRADSQLLTYERAPEVLAEQRERQRALARRLAEVEAEQQREAFKSAVEAQYVAAPPAMDFTHRREERTLEEELQALREQLKLDSGE